MRNLDNAPTSDEAFSTLVDLYEREHGDCDEPECNGRAAWDDNRLEDAVVWFEMSGAASDEFSVAFEAWQRALNRETQ